MYLLKVESDLEKRGYTVPSFHVYSLLFSFYDEQGDMSGNLYVEFHVNKETDRENIPVYYLIDELINPENKEEILDDHEAFLYLFSNHSKEINEWVEKSKDAIYNAFQSDSTPSLFSKSTSDLPVQVEIDPSQMIKVKDEDGHELLLVKEDFFKSDKREWEEVNGIHEVIVELKDGSGNYLGRLSMEFHVLGYHLPEEECDDLIEVYYSVPDGITLPEQPECYIMPVEALFYLLKTCKKEIEAITISVYNQLESHYQKGAPL